MTTADFQSDGTVFVVIDLLQIISNAFEICSDDFFLNKSRNIIITSR